VLERAYILTDKRIILPEHLPEQFGARPEHRRLDDLLGTYSLKQAKVRPPDLVRFCHDTNS
jgi:two-component system response regulator AtoC